MSWFTSELRVRLAPFNRFKPSSKIFHWPFQGGTSLVDLLCFCSVWCFLCLCARLFICALWSPAGKGLISWLLFVVSTVSLSLSHWYPWSVVVLDCIDSWSLHPYLLWLSELFCLCCVAALKSVPALSFNALIIPILRVVCSISFHYSCPWISSMSCTAFKISRWPIFIPRCINSAFYIPVDMY